VRKFWMVFLFAVAGQFLALPARADSTAPGSACPAAGIIMQTGGPEQMPGRELICDGTVWGLLAEKNTDGTVLHQIGYDPDPCTPEKAGRMRFSSAGLWEYCKGSNPWVAL
jgi:hypothetical protein